MAEFNDPSLSPEQQEINKQIATRKRIIRLVAVLGIMVVLRIFIKSPEPPKAPDHSDKPFRAIPGLLETLSPEQVAQLKPNQLAALHEADRKAKEKSEPEFKYAMETYTPAEKPAENMDDKFIIHEFEVRKEKRQAEIERRIQMAELASPKQTLIKLKRGNRYIFVKNAVRDGRHIRMEFDRTMVANIPKRLVKSVHTNSGGWIPQPPIGHVRVKPAKGIEIIVRRSIAKNITIARGRKSDSES